MSSIQFTNSAYQSFIDKGERPIKVYDSSAADAINYICSEFARVDHTLPDHFDYHSVMLEFKFFDSKKYLASWSKTEFMQYQKKIIKHLRDTKVNIRLYLDLQAGMMHDRSVRGYIVAGRYIYGTLSEEQEKQELINYAKKSGSDEFATHTFAMAAPNNIFLNIKHHENN